MPIRIIRNNALFVSCISVIRLGSRTNVPKLGDCAQPTVHQASLESC